MRGWIQRIIDDTERHPSWWLTAIAALLVLAVGGADYVSGAEATFSIFYLLPFFVVASSGRLLDRVAVGALAATTWGVAELASRGFTYSHIGIPVWNLTVRLSVFLLVGHLAATLGRSLRHEREVSRTDALTGLANRRGFFAAAEVMLAHALRSDQGVTVAYLDIDHFKRLNDSAGHAAGDAALQSVGSVLSDRLRRSDVVGRLGGDEFALLLSETSRDGAEAVLIDLHARLTHVLAASGDDVAVSMGAVSFEHPPSTVDELLGAADEVMYAVKESGRNSIMLRTVPAPVANVA